MVNDMEEKINFLESLKNAEVENAKSFLKEGNRDNAKRCLVKKNQYDYQIKQFDGAIMMMQEQQMMLESMEALRNVFDTVKNANEILKEARKGLKYIKNPFDDLDDMYDDLAVKFNVNVGFQIKCR